MYYVVSIVHLCCLRNSLWIYGFFFFSWGSGANPWGPEKDDRFSKPNHWDGNLEVVGVTGTVSPAI